MTHVGVQFACTAGPYTRLDVPQATWTDRLPTVTGSRKAAGLALSPRRLPGGLPAVGLPRVVDAGESPSEVWWDRRIFVVFVSVGGGTEGWLALAAAREARS
jgi:hypothetical protein